MLFISHDKDHCITFFIAQLKFKVHIYKIRQNRYNAVKLSPHTFYSVI